MLHKVKTQELNCTQVGVIKTIFRNSHDLQRNATDSVWIERTPSIATLF
ncbi:hypothetical protein HMPREF1581_00468 [Gardnerella vaginalis JCP8108]|uniref:Uncharacterized protein n=1 Tax=Gardnerella vaginalis JCP8108 TaxID=1261066 RepID=S4H019_GARVA|nr:hypothetical protein HMPREF1581_00468 [Gardnerella vaginalis JCP8108]